MFFVNLNFRFGGMQIVAEDHAGQSARGLAHSKTWRIVQRSMMRVSVLECASPLALFHTGSDKSAENQSYEHAR
jgi:hypothetical protein